MAAILWPAVGGLLATATFVYWNFLRKWKRPVTIKDKVVLITGASSGLGEACAHAFYKAGAYVILSSRRENELIRVKEDLLKLKQDGPCHAPKILIMDVADTASIPSKIQEAISFYGFIDIVVNNAGMSYRGEIAKTDLQVDRKIMDVNYFGQVAVTKAILPHMKERKTGHIMAVSSIQGKLSIPFRSCYSASKHALQAFFDCLRAEVAEDGIAVSIISPSYVQTNISLNAVTGDGSTYAKMDDNQASGMRPEFVANRILRIVMHSEPDVLLGPQVHKCAVYFKNILPRLLAAVMVSRAKKQKKDMMIQK